jgi:hypothetical protein
MRTVQEQAGVIVKKVQSLVDEYDALKQRETEIQEELSSFGVSVKSAKRPPRKPRVKASKNGKVNKSEAIRAYFANHPDAQPKDCIKALGKKGIEVNNTSVWAARKSGSAGNTSGRGRRASGATLQNVVANILSKSKKAMQLKDIVAKVKDSDYKSSAKDKNLSQSVMNVLRKMRDEKVVAKDEKRAYSLNAA